jgi:nascent polypeptide-associated complex subunit alpha
MFNLDPKKMQAVMKQMGIAQEDIPSSKVTIEKQDGGKIVINEPSVTRIKMQDQESFQISGEVSEDSDEGEAMFSEKDIKTLVEQTGCSEKQAKAALEKTGDLVEAIMLLKR